VHVHHLAFRTSDVARLERFYRELLGLRAVERPGGSPGASAWLAAGPTLVMIEPRSEPEPPFAPGTRELVAFSILPADRASFELRLVAAGVTVEERTDFTLYFRDPDGRRIAVSHFPDRP